MSAEIFHSRGILGPTAERPERITHVFLQLVLGTRIFIVRVSASRNDTVLSIILNLEQS